MPDDSLLLIYNWQIFKFFRLIELEPQTLTRAIWPHPFVSSFCIIMETITRDENFIKLENSYGNFKEGHRESQRGRRRYSPSSSRSPSYSSRSRSRSNRRRDSPKRRTRRHSSRSRRRSHSRRRSPRSYPRSPSYHRRTRYFGTRENPYKSRVVGIFGLSAESNEATLIEVFSPFGAIEHVSIIHDAKTGNSRGFGFIYYSKIDQATKARTECNGMSLDGRRIRVDYSITKRGHTPTPGVYMGQRKSSERSSRRHRSRNHSDRHLRRSPHEHYSQKSHSRTR